MHPCHADRMTVACTQSIGATNHTLIPSHDLAKAVPPPPAAVSLGMNIRSHLALRYAKHWQTGQKAMTAVGQARPEPNADIATRPFESPVSNACQQTRPFGPYFFGT